MAEAAPRAAHWRAYALVTLGCLFWLFPLFNGVSLLLRFGPEDDLVWLAAIPVAMIVLTVAIGRFSVRGMHPVKPVAFGTIMAILAALCWLGIAGRGV